MSNSNIIGAFSEEQASRLTGLSRRQLSGWRRMKFMRPTFDDQDSRAPFSHIYSFKDLVKLRVLHQLRNVHRIPLAELQKTAEALSHLGDDLWTATTLYVHRKRIVFIEPDTKRKREVTSKQHVADIPLRIVISSTRDEVARLNERDESTIGKITIKRYINRSAPVIAGTRIPARVIADFLAAGYSTAHILREYPTLTAADVEAVAKLESAAAA
jgi:uncharacterized protein (DUF433 family)